MLAFFERVQKAPSFSLVNDSEKREIFTLRENENDDSLLLPVANGVRRSKLLIYARNCFLVTIFTVVRPFPLNTFTCIRRKEWYSRCANGWTSSFFVGNKKECKICGQPIKESRVVNPKLLHSKIHGQDFQNHVKNLYLSLLFLYSFLLAFLCEDEVGFLFPTVTSYIRRRSF